ncbi:MAG: helix-turn-helix domain-containing protein, partial [Kiritimatiellae bacterium]|nr:helix-turn-helix domain-containing protein [Kiritimatiellia bacterium]
MKHMGQDERNRIEFMLGCGNNVAAIAKALGRSESTISRELLNRRIDSDKHYGRSNRLCARFDDCARTAFNGFRDIRRKNSPGCFESCPDFREAVCVRLNRAPYVCNGCEREHNCPLKKRYYIAAGAQANYRGVLVNSRSGVHPDEATVRRMSDALTPAARQGQSVDAVIAGNPELFGRYARSTIYGWIESGLFAAKKRDLPFAGTRRRPHKRPETKTRAKCRIGHTHADLLEWLKANPGVVPTEADTVIGSISGKVLFTFMIREKFPLAFLRDAKTSQTFTRIVNMLWEVAGPGLFRKLFRCMVPDNGTEFSDPEMVENYRPDPGHNPYKLLPRGVRVFYCDPYCSCQKPHIERFHLELRRILQKGVSFNPLDQ